MVDWLLPGALAGLFAIPLIWWLHRTRQATATFPTSGLFLWSDSPPCSTGAGRSKTTDPAWRRRALAFSCMILGAAGPLWSNPGPHVHVWFDDSLSMATVEGRSTRAEQGAELLADELETVDPATVVLHSLVVPGRSTSLPSTSPDGWSSRLTDWIRTAPYPPHLPFPAAMDRQAHHWLVTDGADPRLPAWLATSRIHRVIRVGETTENVAITRFAVRYPPGRRDVLSAILRVQNLGRREAARKVEVTVGERAVFESELVLTPEVPLDLSFSIPMTPGGRAVAQLFPADVLAADDRIELEFEALEPLEVALVGDCGPGLRAALLALGGIRLSDTGRVVVSCSEGAGPADSQALQFPGPAERYRSVSKLNWTAAAGPLRTLYLSPGWLRVAPPAAPAGDGDVVLLQADDEPVIVARLGQAGVIQVEARLDPWGVELTHRPEFPRLAAGLLEWLSERSLLDPQATVQRQPDASRIAPRLLPEGHPAPIPAESFAWVDCSLPLLLLGLALLLLDSTAWWYRTRHTPSGTAQADLDEVEA